MTMRGTTICAVKRGDQVAIAGDGQVTMGENTVFKSSAKKVRRLYNGQVIAGFAGAVSDAFTLCERFEKSSPSAEAIWSAPPSAWRRTGAATLQFASWRAC